MDWLNYHHLLYFWMVVREGGMAAASRQLHVAQPTLSTQIKKLERALGRSLLERKGRRLELTETGQTVFRYADEIFSLGSEMLEVLQGRPVGGGIHLSVGVPEVVPKLMVFRLLRPALEMPEEVRLTMREGKLEELATELAVHRLDVVISETPLPPSSHIHAFNHLLGECSVTLFAAPELARRHRVGFPKSLNAAPLLMPTQNTAVRRSLELWFSEHDVHPDILHQFEDSALLKVFGQAGLGIFPAPTAIAKRICQQYAVQVVGELPDVIERFYAISVEKRLQHPAVLAIFKAAKVVLKRGQAPFW